MRVAIYALVDPRSLDVRYIGKSIRPVERAANHRNTSEKGCHRANWLRELRSLGFRPVLVILEWLDEGACWRSTERAWISRARALGWPLTNNTNGGDGVEGLPAETRAKMASVWRGRKHSAATKAKISAFRKTFRHSAETRAAMSHARKGRSITWGSKISAAIRALTSEQVEEIHRRLIGGALVKDLAAEFCVHRTTVSKIKMGSYYAQAVKNLATVGNRVQLSLLEVG